MDLLENLPKQDKCVIYSIGLTYESSWEKTMVDRTHCQVYAFDASADRITGGKSSPLRRVYLGSACFRLLCAPNKNNGLPARFQYTVDGAGNPNIHFFKYSIGGEDRVENNGKIWKTLKTVMKENGHEWIDVLKVSNGGSEIDVLNSMMDQFEVLPFSQLQLDVHPKGDMENVVDFKKFVEFWDRLEASKLRAFWTEPDLVYGYMNKDPALSEYSFINIGGKHRLLQNI
jgi:hypothetical protein